MPQGAVVVYASVASMFQFLPCTEDRFFSEPEPVWPDRPPSIHNS